MIYANKEMLLVRLSHVLNSDWLSLECADGNKKGKTKNLSKQ
jgi:hypothetical protein